MLLARVGCLRLSAPLWGDWFVFVHCAAPRSVPVRILSQRPLQRALRGRVIIILTITTVTISVLTITNHLRDDHLMIGP